MARGSQDNTSDAASPPAPLPPAPSSLHSRYMALLRRDITRHHRPPPTTSASAVIRPRPRIGPPSSVLHPTLLYPSSVPSVVAQYDVRKWDKNWIPAFLNFCRGVRQEEGKCVELLLPIEGSKFAFKSCVYFQCIQCHVDAPKKNELSKANWEPSITRARSGYMALVLAQLTCESGGFRV